MDSGNSSGFWMIRVGRRRELNINYYYYYIFFRTQFIKIGTIKMIRFINANVKLKITLIFRNLCGKHAPLVY